MPTARRKAADKYTAKELDDCLTALIAHNGNAKYATAWLEEHGKKHPKTPRALLNWSRIQHWERYEELRERLAAGREEQLANDYLETALAARDATALAVEKAHAKLMAGKDDDPARTAANLSKVSATALEKRLMQQGRPTKITQAKDVEASLRALAAMGVIEIAGQKPELEAGDEQ